VKGGKKSAAAKAAGAKRAADMKKKVPRTVYGWPSTG
jgi:hypothetical protein